MRIQVYPFMAVIIFSFAVASPSFALEAMSDEQIRKLMVDDALKTFDKECLPQSRAQVDTPVSVSDQKTNQKEVYEQEKIVGHGTLEEGYGWSSEKIEAGKKTVKSEQTDTQNKASKCECPCPYSVDVNGRACGTNNAYFNYAESDKPRCYPKDIPDEEVAAFKESHNIQ